MLASKPMHIQVEPRYLHQNASMAVRDVYDALIELITNADDRYVLLQSPSGRIEIEIERRRKGAPGIVRVRDYADGMTLEDMRIKLGRFGGRVSGMAEGHCVRGTNSRGAKDVAVLGNVTFESIAEDGCYHKCAITSLWDFIAYTPSQKVTTKERRSLGIQKGTGMLVTITVEPPRSIPQHSSLKGNLRKLVALREILASHDRTIVLIDLNQNRQDVLQPLPIDGRPVVKEQLTIPGYPEANAKLIIKRAYRRFDDRNPKFRLGGILIKSRRAIHEATLFAPEIETDPHAAWFLGKLTCPYIDELWTAYDDLWEQREKGTQDNPHPIVDPMRKAGLRRDHPFTRALFQQCLKHLRPLITEERKRQERQRGKLESQQTRKRLDALGKAAAKFMQEHRDDYDVSGDANGSDADSHFRIKGYTLSPPLAQIVVGHSVRFWLNIRQEAFPELAVGDLVQVSCLSDEISTSTPYVALERHPTQEGVIRSVWSVRGDKPTKATGLQVTIGSISAERPIEVLESEKDKYIDITDLSFGRKTYSLIVDKPKPIKIYAPCPAVVRSRTVIEVTASHAGFKISGERVLVPQPKLGIACCTLRVAAREAGQRGFLAARLGDRSCKADVLSVSPPGSPIRIKLENVELGNQRSVWRSNVLVIAAKHPSIKRYLGDPDEFKGQETTHFRVLLAEIVAEAVCRQLISKNVAAHPEEYADADWELYYSAYTELHTKFLPLAHESQVPDV